ncbi:epsilon-sarcoglycan-like [Xenia sp. Carnegie-2017]|uniref:epsilon-sarcoglycan-like n=1 Tax=Xenia sp. Carnegie-2017 TaxID=2897299 RepID=UPI001F044677|nr:epsilon-sarcoglycan-like [Xenia sp. Carnegie-2017]
MTFVALVVQFVSISVLYQYASTTGLAFTFSRGFFEKYLLLKRDFSSNNVSFDFSSELNRPELPHWLHLEQRRSSDPAFLYGAPGEHDKSTKLEIIGWNKEKYSTRRIVKDLDVSGSAVQFPYYQAEFFIKNKRLDLFLDSGGYNAIPSIVKNYWPEGDLKLTKVISAIGHGGRVPLPGSNTHEGVIVRVGSSRPWPNPDGSNSTLRPGSKPEPDYFQRNGGFEVDWSRFKLFDLRNMPSHESELEQLLLPDQLGPISSYNPPELDERERDFGNDFILIVILPLLIILLVVFILGIIMCCGREGRRKRDQETPQLNLIHHHNIRRSTLRMRELSKPRDPDSSHNQSRPTHAHGHYAKIENEEDEKHGKHAPPPYRVPPGTAGKGEAQAV